MGNGTSIGRVRGLGSAKSGTHHWIVQRFTAVGNLLLVLWFMVSTTATTWSSSAPAARACAPRWAGAEAGLKTACITKVFPTRSATPSRRRAASPLRWATWARTTGAGTCTTPSRGRTGWATRTRSNTWCARRPRRLRAGALRRAVLAHRGRQDLPAPVRRHDQNYGEGPPVQRTCAAADRTGHAMLHTLYQQSLKHTTPSSSSNISRST
jgi:hypothetical protein